MLAAELQEGAKIPHNVLNARYHETGGLHHRPGRACCRRR